MGWRPRANLPGGLIKSLFSHLGAQGYKTLARAAGHCSCNLPAAGGIWALSHVSARVVTRLCAISQRLPAVVQTRKLCAVHGFGNLPAGCVEDVSIRGPTCLDHSK